MEADALPFAPRDSDSDFGGDSPRRPEEDHLAAARAAVGRLSPDGTLRGLHFSEPAVRARARQLVNMGHRILQLHPAVQDADDGWQFRITYLDAAQDAIRDEDWTEFRRTAWLRVRPSPWQGPPSAA